MTPNRLQDDLLHEFGEEQQFINTQISRFDPLAVMLRKPVAQRLAGAGLLIFGELLCWIAGLGAVAFALFLNNLYPFDLLFKISRKEYADTLGIDNVRALQWAVYGMIALIALLFIFIARALRRVRLKNSILNAAGGDIKILVGALLHRKAALDAITQRHFDELPQGTPLPAAVAVNEVPNPGYEKS